MAVTALITAQEVIDISFIGEENIKTNRIKDSVILSAQEKYLRDKFPGLYDKFLEGEYSDFVKEYIKSPLAYFVRYLILPNIGIQMSNMGINIPHNDFSKGASDRQRDTLRQSALMIAEPLIENAIRYINEHEVDFPEYKRNIKKTTNRVKGGIIF